MVQPHLRHLCSTLFDLDGQVAGRDASPASLGMRPVELKCTLSSSKRVKLLSP